MPLSGYDLLIEKYDFTDEKIDTNMSEVWRARDRATGREVAIKRRLGGSSAERRFEREVNAQLNAAGLHTMPILDWDKDSFDWYVMPWAGSILADRQVPDETLLLPVVDAVVASLKTLHAAGEVHRDLKPDNILWLSDDLPGRWVLADFGIVRNAPGATTATLTVAGGPLGSSGWMAPEQHDDPHSASPSTDVYALGAIAAWIVTGVRPTPTKVTLPQAGSKYRVVLWKATRPVPGDRYPDAAAFRNALATVSASQGNSVATLVAKRDFDALLNHIVGAADFDSTVEELPRLSHSDLRSWYSADAAGVLAAMNIVLESLVSDGIGKVRFGDLDTFLEWLLLLLSETINSGDTVSAETLGTNLFAAISTIGQFGPASAALDWLDRLSTNDQEVMRGALEMAEGWNFFSQMATGRFPSKRNSVLVRQLAGESL